MRKIAVIVKEIKDEIKDADKYYLRALDNDDIHCKETYKYLANQELDHANRLHELVVKKIQEYKTSGGTVPEGMQLVWEYEHKEIITEVDDLKNKIAKL